MRAPKRKAPTSAGTGAGAGYRKLSSDRFTPYIVNPFDPAMAFATLPAIYTREAGRRVDAYRRAARVA